MRSVAIIVAAVVLAAPACAQEAVLSHWVQLAPGGGQEVRIVTTAAACPDLTVDGANVATAERAPPDPYFPVRLCSLVLPAKAKSASLDGMALPVLAIAGTVAYFVTVHVLAPLAQRLPASPYAPAAVRVVYEDGRGVLRKVLETCTSRDFKVADVNVERGEGHGPGLEVAVSLEVHGRGAVIHKASRAKIAVEEIEPVFEAVSAPGGQLAFFPHLHEYLA